MRLLHLLAAAFALLLAPMAWAQDPYLPGRNVLETNPQPIKPMCWNGSAYSACPTTANGPVAALADNKAVTFTSQSSLNGVLFSVDTTGYAGVSSQLFGTWVGTVTFQGSNDNTNWISIGAYLTNVSYSVSSSASSNGGFFIPSGYRWIRAYISAYTSGTVTGNALLKTITPISPAIVALTTGSSTIGAAIESYPSSYSTTYGNAPAAAAAVTTGQVFKASGGLLYQVNVTSGATAGYVMVFNSTTVPADGAVVPSRCYPLAANSGGEWGYSNPLYLSTGVTVVFSSTGCYTKTASATAFIAADAR